jgi:hypothetical protein
MPTLSRRERRKNQKGGDCSHLFLTLIRQGQDPIPLLLLFRANHIVGKDIKNVVTVSPQPQKQAHNEISNT